MLRELSRIGYHKQYVRETPDTFTGAVKKAFGFKTTTATRPVIIANLVQIIRDETYLINDVATLREMLSFVKITAAGPFVIDETDGAATNSTVIGHFVKPAAAQ